MRTNPIADVLAFLTGPSYHEPSWMHFLYWIVALTSLAVAVVAAMRVPGQLTVSHVGRFIIRFIVGSMWWQQALWKFPTDLGGLKYWTEQMAAHAAFQFHREFVQNFILPHFTPIGVAVFFIEILIGTSLMIGLLTRLSAFGGALFIANLWLGLYQVGSEWPWSYFFLVMLLAIFCFDDYGRSLGCDTLLRGDKTIERRVPKFIRVVA
jgi:uncharacterized membrane protein YphA (DoxX/SURF4 family)